MACFFNFKFDCLHWVFVFYSSTSETKGKKKEGIFIVFKPYGYRIKSSNGGFLAFEAINLIEKILLLCHFCPFCLDSDRFPSCPHWVNWLRHVGRELLPGFEGVTELL